LERWKAEATSGAPRPEFQFRALPSEVKDEIVQNSEKLTKSRKSRTISETLSTVQDIDGFTCKNSFPIHKTTAPGILSIDIHPSKPELIVTGGVDKTCVVFNTDTSKKVATLSGHEKQVNTVAFHPGELVISGSDDSTVKVWKPTDDGYECSNTFTEHKAPIVSVNIHPAIPNLLLTMSLDSSWSFYDIEKGILLTQVMDPDRYPFTCSFFHPDGALFCAGTQNNIIRIFDIRTQKNVATIKGHQGPITDVHFSESGIHLASSSEDNTVKEWDLRGTSGPKNITNLDLDLTPTAVVYDYSGIYLGIAAGKEIRVFSDVRDKESTTRDMQHVTTLDDHTDTVTDLRFGPDAKFLVSTSLDKNVKLWGNE